MSMPPKNRVRKGWRMKYQIPEDFIIGFEKVDFGTYVLKTSQTITLSQEESFEFFKDPCNLFEITPDWLDFRMTECSNTGVYEGAEFEYFIKVFGARILWRSRIIDFNPPQRFTDVQLIGPYRKWSHLHTFDKVSKGTLLSDFVTYQLPFYAIPFHAIIKRQLADIFSYRAARISEWASGNFKRKTYA